MDVGQSPAKRPRREPPPRPKQRRTSARRSLEVSTHASARKRVLASKVVQSRKPRTALFKSAGNKKKRRSLVNEEQIKGRGLLKLAIYKNSGFVTVHIMQGKGLMPRERKVCDSYVKLSLAPDSEKRTRCKTEIAHDTRKPNYQETFSLEIGPEDIGRRLQIAVWNRDKQKKCSELLGCMSFGVDRMLDQTKVVNGWYYLLDEKVGVHKHLKAVNKKDKKKTAARRPTLTSAASGSTVRSLPESGGEVFNLPPPKINRDVQWEQPQQITIIKESGSFGFTICSANPVCVNSVDKEGAAARTCLMEGDRILRLNGINVTMVTADQLAAQIRSCEGPVTLLVQRCKQRPEDDNNGRNTTHASSQAAGNTSHEPASASASAMAASAADTSSTQFTMDSTDVRLDTPDFTCPLAPSDTSFTAEIIANLNKITMDTPTKDGHPAKKDTQEEKMEEQDPAVDVLCQENQTACVVDVLRSNTTLADCSNVTTRGERTVKNYKTLCQLEQSRQKAIHTILKSEEHFAAALRSGMQMYLPAVKKQLLPKEHYGKLVANMEKMEGLSRYFASQIGTSAESCLSAPPEAPVYVESVGHIYLGKLAELCATFLGYQEGVRHVVKNLTIKKLSPWSQTYLNTHTFLYKPAQHLSQVAALLDTILRCTSTQHQDFLDLQTVIRALKQAIKSAQESTMRSSMAHDGPSMVPGANLHKIQKSITFAKGVKHFVVNVPKRTLVHAGELTLVEKKKTSKVWTMLFNDILVFTNLKEEGKICVIREPIPMEFVLVNTAENELEFHVTHLSKMSTLRSKRAGLQGNQTVLQASSRRERGLWLQRIEQCSLSLQQKETGKENRQEHSDWSTCGIGERWDIAAMAKYMQDHSEESSKLGLCPLNMGLNGIIQDGGSPQPSPSPESPRDKSMELNSPHVHFLVPNVPHETFEENMEVACPEANNSGTRKRRISFLKRSGTVKKRSDEKDGILLRPRSHSAGVLNKGDGQDMSASQTAESPMSSSQPDLTDLGRQTRKKSRSFAKEMRSKLAFLRKRPAASVSIHVEDMSANTDRVQRLEVEQVTRWSESFEALLNDKCGVQAFHGYLKTEFSEENLEFWMACEEYKQLKPSKQAHRAKKIYNDYIAVQAPRELNLDAEARAETLARLTSPDEGTFKLAQRKIAILMERDSYPRFLRSNLYQALRSQNNTSQILNLTR
ncbi:uncharacterized protein LOC144918404 isoform X2 [Branchiostoma floridae x Branchiostoma belcheri]